MILVLFLLNARSKVGYFEEHRMIKLDEFLSLSERKTASVRFSIDMTKTFEGIKIPHRKQNCLDCDNVKICSGCVTKPKMNCFNCEMERACKTGLDLISQKRTLSTDINMLKRKPANEDHQMLPHYEGKYEPWQNNIDFLSGRKILMKEDDKTVVKKHVVHSVVPFFPKTKISEAPLLKMQNISIEFFEKN